MVSTPIGNLRDITLRALDVLGGVARVYAEDTRVARKLLDAHGLTPRLSSYHDHSPDSVRAEILAALTAGEAIALMSDAGTPLVSDPGYKLARAAVEAGHRVIPIPGASAALAALVASGLPPDRFLFAGFPPAKANARRAFLRELAEVPSTIILYETGPRLAASLAEMAAILGPRPAAIARELTKLFEEVRRGDLQSLATAYAAEPTPKGEIAIVIDGPLPPPPIEEASLDAYLAEALTRVGVKEAATEAALRLGVARKQAYARALALKEGDAAEAEEGEA